jgi:hypothetical protein
VEREQKCSFSCINNTAPNLRAVMVNPNRFYTYAYLREDRTPYYIGKGSGERVYKKDRRVRPPKDKSRIIFLKQNLTEEEAFRHEIYMIAVLGRKDLGTGILHNRTDGGEGASGCIPSEETRRKMSEAGKGRIFSEEHRIKIGQSNKRRIVSEETRKKMSERIRSEETRKKMSESGKVKIFSEEHKRKISEANKNPSEETKRKMSEVKKGRRWWNDGLGNCKLMLECPGNGWGLGRK